MQSGPGRAGRRAIGPPRFVVRPRSYPGGMNVSSSLPGLPSPRVREILRGLPDAAGYRILAKPLRYRTRPHLAAWTDFEDKQIVLQVPQPFLPFGEIVHYGAQRRPGKGLRFVWLSEGVTFRTPREVLRFLYCHEWFHWYLKEQLGRKSAAETACDRFALRNYLRPRVTLQDAQAALRREPETG
jgi:hypothetical protein